MCAPRLMGVILQHCRGRVDQCLGELAGWRRLCVCVCVCVRTRLGPRSAAGVGRGRLGAGGAPCLACAARWGGGRVAEACAVVRFLS